MKYFIGIDLGGMSAKAGLLDENGNLLYVRRCETHAENDPVQTADDLSMLAKGLMEEAKIVEKDVVAVGIGSPGIIDSAAGSVVHWSNFAWKDVPLARLVQEGTHLPVFVTNDANAAALGEAKYGSGAQYEDSVMITLGTGVGGGIVIGGKLFEGYRSAGGELGHTVLKAGGVKCTCGRRGCFERYASATALKRMTREAMVRNRDSRMWELSPDIDNVSGRTAFDAARGGDRAARLVVKKYVTYLGEGIANLVNLLRPQAVILGGGVSNEGENLLKPLRKVVRRNILAPESYAPLELVCASLGNDAGIYGAAAYAMERTAE